MKRHYAPRPWALAILLIAPIPALAAEEPALRVKLEDPAPAEKNRFGMSYKMSFNITAEFRNVGNIGTPGAGRGRGPATGGGIDRFYDDGYNRVDSSGNRDGLTWFWGYENAGQIVGDTLAMHSTSVAPISSKTIDGDPQSGLELTYGRELGRLEKHNAGWGLEAALGWTYIDIADDRPLAGGVRTITDTYDLGGVIPPPAPYNGTFQGPGPLIDDAPARAIVSSARGAVVTGERHFEADLFAFRLGPYIDCPIDENWMFSISAGPAVGIVDGEFRFRQTVKTDTGRRFQSGSGSETDIVFGGYLSGTIHWAINEQWGLFIGGHYTALTSYEVKAGEQKAEIRFARVASATFGVTFSF
ncbi:MAG TPA: hypothetical protein VNT99_00030 [Methylomirabilota bacterium]|nr:hypothetical protein [Methylomirabilota bacterium]